MSTVGMALRGLVSRPLSSCLTALSVASGVALVVFVVLVEQRAGAAFRQTAVGVEVLVAGDKGGRIDAVLAALFHVGRATGTLPGHVVTELRDDARVAAAIPIALGDRYRGLPVVGTTGAFFREFEPRPGVGFGIGAGELDDAQVERPAVLGAAAARRTGLGPGDRFEPSHTGLPDDPTHRDEPFTVVGVARPTGTAHDRAIWVRLEDFAGLKGHDRARAGALTAILVRTTSPSPLVVEPLIAAIDAGGVAQAVRPVQVVAELMELVGGVRRALQAVAAVVVAVAAVSVMLALHAATASRAGEIATLRALGAGRGRISAIVLLEAVALCGAGAFLGAVLAHAGAAFASPWIEAWSGVSPDAWAPLLPQEPLIIAGVLVLGTLAGALPAWTAYRQPVASRLSP